MTAPLIFSTTYAIKSGELEEFREFVRRPLVGADHNILWFGEELAGEEGFEPSIS